VLGALGYAPYSFEGRLYDRAAMPGGIAELTRNAVDVLPEGELER
jgi:hypothetical protein